jgi:hypothetical protein
MDATRPEIDDSSRDAGRRCGIVETLVTNERAVLPERPHDLPLRARGTWSLPQHTPNMNATVGTPDAGK